MKRKRKCGLFEHIGIGVLTTIFILAQANGLGRSVALEGFSCLEPSHKLRSSYINDYYPIDIRVTDRPSHQIVSRIFAIFLREVMGYRNISIIPLPDLSSKEAQTQYFLDSHLTATQDVTTIDLEVWKYSMYETPYLIYEADRLYSDPGRFAIFVPRVLLTNSSNFHYSSLHYSVFKNSSSEQFESYVIDPETLDLMKPYEEYISPYCDPKNCATILSEFKKDTDFVEHLIEAEKLQVRVLWLRERLSEVVEWLFLKYNISTTSEDTSKKFAVLHWHPSHISIGGLDYETMTMPNCELMTPELRENTMCRFEVAPIVKYYTKPKKGLHPLLINALNKVRISPESFLLNYHGGRSEDVYNNVSCEWIRNNDYFSSWLESNEETQMEIAIGLIAPLALGASRSILTAAKMATDAINRNSSVLPRHRLTLEKTDGECNLRSVVPRFVQYVIPQTPVVLGIVGPACSDTIEPIAGMVDNEMAIITYAAEGGSYHNRQTYPYFFRTIGSNSQYEPVLIELFNKFHWREVAALTEEGQVYTEYIARMEDNLFRNNIKLIANKKYPRDVTSELMRRNLQELKQKRAKIVIADVARTNGVLIALCEAFKLKMTAREGYVWFLPSWLSKDSLSNCSVSCTREELLDAIDGHLSLRHSPFGEDSSPTADSTVTVHKWKEEYLQKSTQSPTPSNLSFSGDDYVGFAYDAVWTYALAADQLARENIDLGDIRDRAVNKRFAEIIASLDFNGVSGRIRFDSGGSRLSTIDVMQWNNGGFEAIGHYYPVIDEDTYEVLGGDLEMDGGPLVWRINDQPKDGTYDCALSGFASILHIGCEHSVLALVLIICVLSVIIVASASFVFWKRRFDVKLRRSAKMMKSFGIDLLSPSNKLVNTLDKWEISKDRIVMNRRLGEGAFGTVFGGEAQLSDGWTAVAIKTLKKGVSTEDRLDFLSEAEVMKRFDHDNIIRLVGVLVQSEPISIVMEFMLYGDLKTYLLARRHMVSEKVSDESDVSSKRLTMYALDVARALSYLADQKYVHRDIACRNCLVSSNRVVKLADFGMARSMYENDYYRFNRRGMLPVRWMAPESLGLGLFTPASDVWSFGVLLYEIITFGSFPYQGMTNHHVLEYVKAGNTLKIPRGIKPHLEGLFKACWHKDHKKRIMSTEAVIFIASYPRLLTPCLDVPISSVQMMESSDELEVLPLNKSSQPHDILNQTFNINNLDTDSERSLTVGQTTEIPTEMLNVRPSTDESCYADDEYIESSQMTPLISANDKEKFLSQASTTNLDFYVNVSNTKEKQKSDVFEDENFN